MVEVVSNSDGFRSKREFDDQHDARTRIVVLGDSLVFGEGVQESHRFTEILEQQSPSWRVDNLGMIGYGPDLMLRAFEAVGANRNPHVVVVCVYTDDIRRVSLYYSGVGFPIPRFVLEDGQLTTVGYPEPHIWERTRFFQGLLYAYWRYTPATFDLNEAILDRFSALAREGHFALGIVFLPSANDFADDRRRRKWLAQYALRRAIPFRDLTDTMRGGAPGLYIPNDSHWNEDGHRLVARDLSELIREHLLTRPASQ